MKCKVLRIIYICTHHLFPNDISLQRLYDERPGVYYVPTALDSGVAGLCLGSLAAAVAASITRRGTVAAPARALYTASTGLAACAPRLPRPPVAVNS